MQSYVSVPFLFRTGQEFRWGGACWQQLFSAACNHGTAQALIQKLAVAAKVASWVLVKSA
jgi:hypothetical protein